jgi:hemophore-related protein
MLTSVRLVVAVGGLALLLTSGAGVASAEPDLSPLVNTTCTYSQAVAALDGLSPEAAEEFYTYPMAQSWLSTFLDSSVDQRWQLIQTARNVPALQPYTALGLSIARTCKNY